MTTEDTGWAGSWDIPTIDEQMLQTIKELVGAPVMNAQGRPFVTCSVNLRTGEIQYPIAAQRGRGR